MKKTKENRGGARKGTGPKPKPTEEIKTLVAFYTEKKVIDANGGMDECKKICTNFLKLRYLKNKA